MASPAVLSVTLNGKPVKTQPLAGEVVVGRAEDCVVRLDDRAVSRQHAVFRTVGDAVQVENKSEFGPLVVNGNEATSAVLKDGDIVMVGPYSIRLAMEKREAPIAAANSQQEVRASVNEIEEYQHAAESDLAPLGDGGRESPSATAPIAFDPPEMAPENAMESGIENAEAAPIAAVEGGENSLPLEAPLDGGSAAPLAGEVTAPPVEQNNSLVLGGNENGNSINLGPPAEISDPSVPVAEDAPTKVGVGAQLNAVLIFPEGLANYAQYKMEKSEISIGRGRTCDITLNDKKSSRKHAIITRVGAKFSIKDLDSANGLYVNGARVQEAELSGDDRIKIGDVEFSFQATSTAYENQEKNFLQVNSLTEDTAPVQELESVGVGIEQASGVDTAGMPVFEMQQSAPQLGQDQYNQQVAAMPPGGYSPQPAGFQQQPPPGYSAFGAKLTAGGGIPGMITPAPANGSLVEKFRALPKRRQYIWVGIIVGGLYFLLFDDVEQGPMPEDGPNRKVAAVQKPGKPTAGPLSFEALSPEQKKFVESQHAIAFEYYKNRDYDKALFEIRKIFSLIPDYKDSKEIERYAMEGKRKLDAIEEEKRRKEEEQRIKTRIAELMDDAKLLMSQRKFETAKEKFNEILSIDPENAQVLTWQKELEEYEEQRQLKAQQDQIQGEINNTGRNYLKEGIALKNQGKFHSAIKVLKKVAEIGTSDRAILARAIGLINACRYSIAAVRDPLLAQGRDAETQNDYAAAYQAYLKASKVDPGNKLAVAGMGRVRGYLHEKAKVLYTEAVIAESYSDFSSARKKFEECMKMAPIDDIYHQRSQRKLTVYLRHGDN